MPPRPLKKLSSAQQPPPASQSNSIGETEEEPVKVGCLYDCVSIKAALDDCAREVVLDAGYQEDYSVSNTKIALGLAAIACALYAQFGPGKFPATWWPVACCVAAYSIITLILNWYSQTYEGDAFLITKPSMSGDVGPRVASHLGKYEDDYKLRIYTGQPKTPGYREAVVEAKVYRFFHADGYLSDSAFKPVVETLLQDYLAKADKKSQ